mmetsp:Transcript_16966/g.40614  ORF Transcript_16966/g.40614 Transcript_16966/m.40614 type:complete len:134 (-) Transcript_16966:1614-2015(-)
MIHHEINHDVAGKYFAPSEASEMMHKSFYGLRDKIEHTKHNNHYHFFQCSGTIHTFTWVISPTTNTNAPKAKVNELAMLITITRLILAVTTMNTPLVIAVVCPSSLRVFPVTAPSALTFFNFKSNSRGMEKLA